MKTARKEETTLDLLVHEGLLDAASAAQVAARARDLGESLSEAAVGAGLVTEKDIAKTLCKHLSLPYLDVTRYFVKREVFEIMPAEFWGKNRVLPLDRIGEILIVGTCEVLPASVLEEIEVATNCKVRVYISTPVAVAQAMRTLKEQLQAKTRV